MNPELVTAVSGKHPEGVIIYVTDASPVPRPPETSNKWGRPSAPARLLAATATGEPPA